MGVGKKCNTGFLNVITKCEIILLKKPGLGTLNRYMNLTT